jgi:hypothetical protein
MSPGSLGTSGYLVSHQSSTALNSGAADGAAHDEGPVARR